MILDDTYQSETVDALKQVIKDYAEIVDSLKGDNQTLISENLTIRDCNLRLGTELAVSQLRGNKLIIKINQQGEYIELLLNNNPSKEKYEKLHKLFKEFVNMSAARASIAMNASENALRYLGT